jgi:hypothetical protein
MALFLNHSCNLWDSGRLDASTPGNGRKQDGSDLRAAISSMLEGGKIDEASIQPTMGCSIKWKPGNSPPYF